MSRFFLSETALSFLEQARGIPFDLADTFCVLMLVWQCSGDRSASFVEKIFASTASFQAIWASLDAILNSERLITHSNPPN